MLLLLLQLYERFYCCCYNCMKDVIVFATALWKMLLLLLQLYERCYCFCYSCMKYVIFVATTVWKMLLLLLQLYERCYCCCYNCMKNVIVFATTVWKMLLLLLQLYERCYCICYNCMKDVIVVATAVWKMLLLLLQLYERLNEIMEGLIILYFCLSMIYASIYIITNMTGYKPTFVACLIMQPCQLILVLLGTVLFHSSFIFLHCWVDFQLFTSKYSKSFSKKNNNKF